MSEPLTRLLDLSAIHPDAVAADRDTAIRLCGQALVDVGAAAPAYVDSMLAREGSVSTYIGEGVAIPHGTAAGKDSVLRDALCVLRFPGGVDWNGHAVAVCIGIAARGDGHIGVLAQLAEILLDPDQARALREATTREEILDLLRPTEGAPAS
jgi:PTS system mannitol-specific IIA component